MPRLVFLLRVASLTLAGLGLAACSGDPDKVPFPSSESEFPQPAERPFKFSDPVPIEWETYDPATIKPFVTRRLNFASLPTKPFAFGGYPKPLTLPLEEEALDWKSFQDTVFDYKTLPTQRLRFNTILMQPPTVVKAGYPNFQPGNTRGVMEVGAAFGLPGIGRCFLQDKAGMFWIGTDKGLVRYDGVNLEIYGAEQGFYDPNIWSVCEDAMQRIWIGTGTGEVFVLDRVSGFIRKLMDTFPRGPVYGLTRDRDGQIWVTRSGQGYVIVNEKDQTVKSLTKKEGLAGNQFTLKTIQDKANRYWLSSQGGLTIIDPQAGKISRSMVKTGTMSALEDREGNIWIGRNDGVRIFNLVEGTVKGISSKHGLDGGVIGLYQDRDGMVWVATNKGTAYALRLEKNEIEKFNIGPSNGNIYSITEDTEGQLWFGSAPNLGSYVINRSRGRAGNFTTADGLGSNAIWSSVEAKDGKIWLGTRNGIDIYDPKTQTIRHLGTAQGLPVEPMNHLYEDKQGQFWAFGNNFGITVINEQEGTIKTMGRDQGLRSPNIQKVWEDEAGQVWMGSVVGETFVYNPVAKQLKRITNLATHKDGRTYSMNPDNSGQLWIANEKGGIAVVDRDRKTIRTLTISQGLLSNTVYNTLSSSTGEMWIGTNKGINILNLGRQTITNLTTQQGLINNDIWTLNERNGVVYAGTTRGLSMISSRTDEQGVSWQFTNYGKAQGLQFLDFDLNSAIFTKKGEFWSGVEIQVLMIMNDPLPDLFIPTPHLTGIRILDTQMNFRQRVKAEQHLAKVDTLWEPVEGAFYPDRNQALAERFTETGEITWDSVESNSLLPVNLRLPYHQNYLSFSFAGLALSNPDQVKYRYVLEGIDKNWSPISTNTQSENYRDLPPGKYIFKVCSKGMNGQWSAPASFSFTILPPWWKSWWAYSLYAILFGLVGWRTHLFQKEQTVKRERERMKDRELAQAKEIEKAYNELKATQSQLIQSEKMASLGELTAGIAHEIQNPLNFVNNFSEINKELLQEMKEELEQGRIEDAKGIAKSIIDNEEKILFHGKRADSIVKGMLQHSRASSGVKEPTDINALADEYLRLAYHGLRAKDKSFNAAMKTDLDTSLGKVNVVPQDLGRVILNLITNGFYAVTEKKKSQLNGYEPTVTVITRKTGDKVKITVQDNGNGIPDHIKDKIFQPFFTTKPSGQGTGLGLSMSYDIVTKVHGGKIDVDTRPGEGTSFIITIPIQPS
jgi:signal transduction histidine kinase/ligand-binding sensor domain-containing protein